MDGYSKKRLYVKEELMNLATKKHVGTFHAVDTVLYKITELGSQGFAEN